MNRHLLRTLLVALALAVGPPAAAQAPQTPSTPAADPIGSKLFPPELIMTHQAEIGLEDRQREAILKELEKAQSQFPRLQWQLQAASQQLSQLLDAPQVDEAKALAQAGEVMKLETEIKRAHLALLIRIRNTLSDTQRSKLLALRRATP
ncbi:MAG TPA: periplasmic heavy metal sensor [Myxococcaceae bacterium]|nr:periplasmic heavy metal sensor [Myxococcaceae bacterium]